MRINGVMLKIFFSIASFFNEDIIAVFTGSFPNSEAVRSITTSIGLELVNEEKKVKQSDFNFSKSIFLKH